MFSLLHVPTPLYFPCRDAHHSLLLFAWSLASWTGSCLREGIMSAPCNIVPSVSSTCLANRSHACNICWMDEYSHREYPTSASLRWPIPSQGMWDLINPISPQLHLDVIMKGLRPSAMTHMYALVRRFKNVQTAGSVSREVPAAWPFKCSVHTTWKVLLRVTGQYSKDRILVSIRQAEFSETMDEHRTGSKSCLWCHSERWVVKVWLESYSQLCGREYIPDVLAKAHDLKTSKLQQ